MQQTIGGALALLPPELRAQVQRAQTEMGAPLTEIRVRTGRRVQLLAGNRERMLDAVFDAAEMQSLVSALCGHSMHALGEQLRGGYLPLPGGCRAGLCGRAIATLDEVGSLSDIASVCLRIAHEHKGTADALLPALTREGLPLSTLILSGPGLGKTTMLRDIARQFSEGAPGRPGMNVAIADERSEIAACYRGVPQLDVGPRTDVLDGCPKALALPMLLRAMSPRLLIADEIGDPRDVNALYEALRSGVAVITSAHAEGYEQALKRPALRELLSQGYFERVAALGGQPGRVARLLDGHGGPIAR